MSEQLSVSEALVKLSFAMHSSIMESGLEWGMALAEGNVEDCNNIQRAMCGMVSYRQHFQRIGQEMLEFQAQPQNIHPSIPTSFALGSEIRRYEDKKIENENVLAELDLRKEILLEERALLNDTQLDRTELVQNLISPQELISPIRGRRRPKVHSETENYLGPKNARTSPKPGTHTSKSNARRTLQEGTYTHARDYEPWLLRAMLKLGNEVGFAKIQHEMRDIMTERGVIKDLDLAMTGTNTPRYQAQTNSLRNSMERRGLILRNSLRKWELTGAGQELAQNHNLEYNQSPARAEYDAMNHDAMNHDAMNHDAMMVST